MNNSSTTTIENKEEILNEVWSWIHNEVKCISVRYISFHFHVSRNVACEILKEIPTWKKGDEDIQYELIRCVIVAVSKKQDGDVETSFPKQVMQLKRNVISSKNNNNKNALLLEEGTIYSLCVKNECNGNNNVIAAHERDMVYVREQKKAMLSQCIIPTILPSLELLTVSPSSPNNNSSKVNSTISGGVKPIQKKDEKKKVSTSSTVDSKENQEPNKKATVATTKSTIKSSNKKATTASSFFGLSKVSTTKPKSKKSDDDTTTKKTNEKSTISGSTQDIAKSAKTTTSKRLQLTKISARTTKPSTKKQKMTSSGNVDDFIGDMDENEEEDEEEEREQPSQRSKVLPTASKPRAKKKQKQEKKPEPIPNAEEDDDEDNHLIRYDDEPDTGAMDSFIQQNTNAQPKPPNPHKGKKKRLVDKQYMDSNGYLITEKAEEWVDVDVADVEEEKVVDPSKDNEKKKSSNISAYKKQKVGNTKGLKQGSLTSFFKKK